MTILAATDRSENSRAALRYAARLAKHLGEPLAVGSALELWERREDKILPTFEGVEIEPSEHAVEVTRKFVDSVFDERPELHVVVGHPPAEKIIEIADEVDASVIVAGTSGNSRLTERFFGSTISALARRATRPVLAVPPDFDGGLTRILAPVDFSACSEASLRFAAKLAERAGAELYVQHSAPFSVPTVAPPIAYVPETADDILKAAGERLKAVIDETGVREQVTKSWVDIGPPHPDIARAVEKRDIDLIVMGTHGRTGIARFFLGSTAERILRDRHCPVLVIRERKGKS